MNYLIPFICAGLFRLGGWGKYPFLFIPGFNAKFWRWLGIGIVLAIFCKDWRLIPVYYIVTNISYGDNSWLKKLVGTSLCWLIYGFMFGAVSYFALGLSLGFSQAAIGALVFLGTMSLSNYGYEGWYLDHKWVELCIGFFGTLLYLFY